MFDHRHYVPVLRWKRGEWNALKGVDPTERRYMTPLVEVAPKDFDGWRRKGAGFVSSELGRRVSHLPEVWEDRPAFIDAGLLDPAMRGLDNRHPVEISVEVVANEGGRPIPVFGLNRTDAYLGGVRRSTAEAHGLGLRLTAADLRRATLRRDVARLLATFPQGSAIDLIIDLGVINAGAPSVQQMLDRVGGVNRWRTFTVISGAFPKDLSEFRPGEHTLRRADWIWWLNQISGNPRPTRLPAFGDYTTQHGRFSEPPPRPNFSASIRYTADDHWVIMRGEGVFTDGGPGFAQWPANARMLCAREEYRGEAFSQGDAYIRRMASLTKGTGNAETWLSASINHHLVLSARQVASLAA